jgi:xanthine dehydrogenase molybdopterin-binding subunit B
MKRQLIPLLLLLLTACAGGVIANNGKDIEMMAGDDSYDSTTDFDVAIDQATTPMAMPAAVPGPVDVKYVITVENHTKSPVQLKRIDLQSVGTDVVRVDVSTRRFDKTIEAGAKTSVEYWATAQIQDATIGAKSPMVIRTRLHLQSGDAAERLESFTRRVNGHLSVGVGG